MANTVDERIVAAKFDASDFEKGVNKTIKKLDELKKSLDLKGATKGVKELAEKTEASTDSMSKSLDKLTERFTTFTGMIKQKILGGLADEVANVFLRMEQSVKNFIKGISTDQVNVGLSKYEQMLTSVRVMMSAGESQESAYEAIDTLREYSDQTSYSLSQMTDALSKMKAAGVDVNTATKSVEGIANACANAGINATDAQRAFFNLSQAYSSGVLKYTDYRSLELLNMTTKDFKQNLLEAAVTAGTLEKAADGTYKTINKNNKKVTAGKKVTEKNLQDMLRYNFVTSDVMNELFGGKFFFDERTFKAYKTKYKDLESAIEAAKKDYGETAVNAYLAAREARSFTDVINTLKDVVSTGWATTFEHLFGKLEEAKEFFTQLAEGELADVVYKIGEYRNAILGFWNITYDASGEGSGGKVFRDTIINITDAIGELLKVFLQILPGFEELDYEEGQIQPGLAKIGEKLFEFTLHLRTVSKRIKEAVQNFNLFMNTPMMENGPTRIELIRNILANLANVFGIIGKVVSVAFHAISRAFYTLSPIFDGFMILLEKVTEPLVDLNNNADIFNNMKYAIDDISTVLAPVAKIIGDIVIFLGDIAKFIAGMALDSFTYSFSFFADVVDTFMELFTGSSTRKLKEGESVLDGIRKDFEGIKSACSEGLGAIKEFFSTLLADICKLFGLTSGDGKKSKEDGGVFSGLINFFNTNAFVQKAKNWVNQAIIDIGEFIRSIPARVKRLGANIYDTIFNLFFTREKTRDTDGKTETKTVLTPLGEWLNGIIEGIKEFIISIPQKIIDGVGIVGNWIDSVFNMLFGYEDNKDEGKTAAKDAEAHVKDEIDTNFETFINNVVTSVKEWFADLPNKVRTAMANVGNFFNNLVNTLDEFLFGKKVTSKFKTPGVKDGGKSQLRVVTTRYKTGFSKWLDQAIKDVKEFIAKIPEYIKAGIKGAGDIISTIINALFGKSENDKEADNKDVEDRLQKPFLGINISNILNTIKDIGVEILNQIARIFTGSDDIEHNQDWFARTIASGIEWIREKAKIAFDWVLEFIGDIPKNIAKLFKGESKDDQEQGPIGQAISGFGASIGEFISGIPEAIREFIDSAVTEIGNLWDDLYNRVIGDAEDTTTEAQNNASEEVDAVSGAAPTLTGWQKFVKNIGETISKIFTELPTWIAQGIDMALVAIDKLIQDFTSNIEDTNMANEAAKSVGDETSNTVDKMAESIEKTGDKDKSRLLIAVEGIGTRLRDLFVITIPGFISQAWTLISGIGSEIWSGISYVFDPKNNEPPDTELGIAAENVASVVKDFITNKLPEKIRNIWQTVKFIGSGVYDGFSALFTGNQATSEIGKAVQNFGQTIYNFIVTDIPKFIHDAFSFISGIFKKHVPFEEEVMNVEDIVENTGKKGIKKLNEGLKEKVKKPGVWSFVSDIGTTLGDLFTGIGPTILNGLSTALDFLSRIGEIIFDALSGNKSVGDQIEEAYGEEKPELKSALHRIGESIRKFFLETIPKLIGSAIGTLAKEAPKWFSNLFGAMSDAEDDAADEFKNGGGGTSSFGNAVNNATDVLGIAKNIFNELKTWVGENKDFLEIMGVIIGLSILFSRLSDLFGIADELDSGASLAKWAAITIAITAIAGIWSYITQLLNEAGTDMGEYKIKKFEDILNKLGDILLKIALIAGIFATKELFSALGNKWDKSDNKLNFGQKILGGLSDSINGFFNALGTAAGTMVIGKAAEQTVDDLFGTVSESFVELSSGVEEMISIVAPFVDELASMDTKLDQAIRAAEKTGTLFLTLYNTFGHLYENATGGKQKWDPGLNEWILVDESGQEHIGSYKNALSMEGFISQLNQRVDLFSQLSIFIHNMSEALSKIENVKSLTAKMQALRIVLSGADFGEFMTELMDTLKKAVDASEISPEKFGSTQYMVMRQSGMALALEMLSSSLSIFADGISGFDETSVKAMKDALNVFNSLYESIDDTVVEKDVAAKAWTGDNSLSKVGNEIKLFGLHMKTFYGYIKDIPGFVDQAMSDETTRKISSITTLVREFALAMQDTITYGSAAQVITELGGQLPTFGDAIQQFYNNLDRAIPENMTVERMEILVNAVNGMSLLMSGIRDLSNILGETNLSVSTIMDKLFTGMSDDLNSQRFASLIRVFNEAVASVMADEKFAENYKEYGKNIAKNLFLGIQSAFDEDPNLRPKIHVVPVIDYSSLEDERTETGTESGAGNHMSFEDLRRRVEGANAQTDADRLTATIFREEVTKITNAISEGPSNSLTAADLINAFTQIKIVTDTNVLAGEMTDSLDAMIGEKIWLIQKGIAVSP